MKASSEERQAKLIQYIHEKPSTYNRKQLADIFKVSQATISKDVSEIKKQYAISYHSHYTNKSGYYFKESIEISNDYCLNKTELKKLHFINLFLEKYAENQSHFKSEELKAFALEFNSLLKKIERIQEKNHCVGIPKNEFDDEKIYERINSSFRYQDYAIILLIEKAIQTKKQIKIILHYDAFENKDKNKILENRVLEPIKLIYDEQFYLYAVDTKHRNNEPRTFKVSEIYKVHIMDVTSSHDMTNTDTSVLIKSMKQDKMEDIRIEIQNENYSYLKQHEFCHFEKETISESKITIKFRYPVNQYLVSKLLFFMTQFAITIISPASLKNLLKHEKKPIIERLNESCKL